MNKSVSLLFVTATAIAMLSTVGCATAPIILPEMPTYTIISENVTTKVISASATIRPLTIHTEQRGVAYYEGTTRVTGNFIIDATDNSDCTYCFYIDADSSAMIPRASIEPNTAKRKQLVFNIDSRDLSALGLNKEFSEDDACYSVPMTLEIKDYAAVHNSRREPSDARIVNIIRKGAVEDYDCA